MIGVAASSTDMQIAEEFFELFKTPWERAVPARKYAVVLSTEGTVHDFDAELFLVYGSDEHAVDRESGTIVEQVEGPVEVVWGESRFPIYGRVAVLGADAGASTLKVGDKPLDCRHRAGARAVRRIGYDLFREIGFLLTEGQPPSQASTPTLELHIALLRHLLAESGVAFVEIPPRPHGYDFMCCLTHDVDFFGVRGTVRPDACRIPRSRLAGNDCGSRPGPPHAGGSGSELGRCRVAAARVSPAVAGLLAPLRRLRQG